MEPAEVHKLARNYFVGGCLCLPWLWLVNFIYIYPAARKRSDLPASVRTYLYLSLAGSVVWTIALTVWMSLYFTRRNYWGSFGDLISISLPKG
ncbi:gamma-secretase aspartyl protease complex, presenilin enhancer-2 subunit [Zopfochytrium polystomum]|nr:gamma-secretase aspartyl protease complex, presenilin enhancer-2 subunit [Zopfochytrium polystomum]